MTALSVDVLSVIVPVHDVAEYLPEFLSSLDAQGSALPTQLIFIDDGSTDSSPELVEAWIAAGRAEARLVRTRNHGVSSARNRGMDEATGTWALFLDPDDVLAPGYFTALLGFLSAHPEVDLAATNLLRLQEPDTRLRDNHPLRFRFAGGDRVAELADDVFVMNAASVAFPLAAVRASGARFRTGLHASEDALFVSEYLLSLGRAPRAGFVAGARYGYRKRQARTSAVDRYRSDPSTYTLRFHGGYAPLLEKAAVAAGGVPSWLQSVLLYEMQWLLPVQMDPQRYAENLSDAQRSETLAGIARCLRHVTDDRLLRYDASALPLESRLLILALTGRPLWDWVGAYARLPRGWRKVADLVAYSSGSEPDAAATESVISWHPDYFGQQALTAHRLRTSPRSRRVAGRSVIWPRAGESLTQTQDRHRRSVAECATRAIPARDGEVYVRRTRAWASDRAQTQAVSRESRRRHLWSKDALIGRMLRPGRSVLIEDDPDERLRPLVDQLRTLTSAHSVTNPDANGVAADCEWRFGSLQHRAARARARLIISTLESRSPSLQSRLRGVKVLVAGDLTAHGALLAIRRRSPELVVVPDESDVARLSTIGIPPTDVVVAPPGDPQVAARALIDNFRQHPLSHSRKGIRFAA